MPSFKKCTFPWCTLSRILLNTKEAAPASVGRSEGRGEKKRAKKEENNFQKIYFECVCQVYECRVEFGAKPETVQLRSLKADLEKSAVRIMLADLLLACQGMVESRHCLFTLICQGCMQEYWQKISPLCTSCSCIPLVFPLHLHSARCRLRHSHFRAQGLYWCRSLIIQLC